MEDILEIMGKYHIMDGNFGGLEGHLLLAGQMTLLSGSREAR